MDELSAGGIFTSLVFLPNGMVSSFPLYSSSLVVSAPYRCLLSWAMFLSSIFDRQFTYWLGFRLS